MTAKRYVLFREDPNTHQEVYVSAVTPQKVVMRTTDVESALHFSTAADGYRVGAWQRPALDWWRVGQR